MTRKRNAEAARLEADYLSRVRSALAGRDASEIDEVAQSLAEHIEEDLSGETGEVTLVQMANVLEHLGPPEAFAGEPEEPPSPAEKPRTSRLAIVGILGVPVGVVVFGLVAALGFMLASSSRTEDNVVGAGAIIAFAIILAGFVVSLFARGVIRRSDGMLRGERLAKTGVWLPVFITAVTVIASFAWYAAVIRPDDQKRGAEYCRDVERSSAEVECKGLWIACHDVLTFDRPVAETVRDLLVNNALAPAWAADARAGRLADENETILVLRGRAQRNPAYGEIKFRTLQLEGTSAGNIIAGNDTTMLSFPVVRIDGRWYLARRPVLIW